MMSSTVTMPTEHAARIDDRQGDAVALDEFADRLLLVLSGLQGEHLVVHQFRDGRGRIGQHQFAEPDVVHQPTLGIDHVDDVERFLVVPTLRMWSSTCPTVQFERTAM